MKKHLSVLIFCLSISMSFVYAQTHPVVYGNGALAEGNIIEFTQPDNQVLIVKLWGDAVINWLETEDGYKLVENDNGYLEYAAVNVKGDMVPSGYIAKNLNKRTRSEIDFLSSIGKDIFYSEEQLELKRSMAVYGKSSGEKMGGFPATGNRRLLIILARYSDQSFTYSQSAFNNLFNQTNYNGTGSFKDYFYEVSYGQLVVTTTVTQVVTLPNTRAYYGANTGGSGSDVRAALAVRHAIQAAHSAGVNFSPFDNDGDGYVDMVAVIHSGTGEETSGDPNDIWSHNWALQYSGYGTLYLGGKYFNNYTMQPEKYTATSMTGIGVICHEFGHAIGLPDFYDTNGNTGGYYNGTGYWDLMASGAWLNSGRKPAHPNAWSKVFLGWVTPITLSAPANITAKNVEQNKQIYRINTGVTNDYFLLENRQKHGFDTYIPQSGLLIYHIHPQIGSYISNNTVNTTHPQRLYIVPAGSTTDPKTGNYGNINATSTPYPGSANKTSFMDNTVPNMKTWSGANVNKPITNITHNTSTKEVSFKFMGGSTSGGTPTATTHAATNVTSSSARINAIVNANNNSVSVSFLVGTSSSNLNLTYNATPATVSGTSNTSVYHNLSGLTTQTQYYYRVRVVYNGNTVLGNILSFTTGTQGGGSNLPLATTVAQSNLTTSTVTLNGQVRANNLSTAVRFQIWTSSNSSNPWEFNANPVTVTGNTNTNVSLNLSQLSTNTTYYFRVKATSTAGTVYGSTLSFSTGQSGSVPTAITLAATNITTSTVTLNGQVKANNLSTTVKFQIWTSSNSSNPWEFNANPATVTGNTNTNVSVGLTQLSANTTYYFRVKATNSAGTVYGSAITFSTGQTSGAPLVTTLAASNTTANSVKLNGQVNANNATTTVKFQIWISSNSSNPWEFNASPATVSGNSNTSVSVNLTSLMAGTTYYFRVKANNSFGTSTGNTLSFTTPQNAPLAPEVIISPVALPDNFVIEQLAAVSETDNSSVLSTTITVYPNPASDYIILNNTVPNTSIKIFDAAGRLVISEVAYDTGDYFVSIAHLAKGAYVILTKSEQRLAHGRFMVTN